MPGIVQSFGNLGTGCGDERLGKCHQEKPLKSESVSPGKSASSEKQDPAKSSKDDLLPDFIKDKTYSGLPFEQDKALWKDLVSKELQDKDFIKYVFIDGEGKAYINMPTRYHENIVTSIVRFVGKTERGDDPVFATASGKIELLTGSDKYPDVHIFGPDRLNEEGDRKTVSLQGDALDVNPNAIVEVSWTNDVDAELKKFELQMTARNPELGKVNVGYLIRFTPAKTGKMPSDDDRTRPLRGFDVYKMRASEDGEDEPPPTLFYAWRAEQDLIDDKLKFTADELGGRKNDLIIPLSRLINGLKVYGIQFVKEKEAES